MNAALASEPVPFGPEFPRFRYLGSKRKLLRPILESIHATGASRVTDAFSGSGCVGYELKRHGFQVTANDVLRFAGDIATGVVANDAEQLGESDVATLLGGADHPEFVTARTTFAGLYFSDSDNRFIDRFCAGLSRLGSPRKEALARAVLYSACLQKRPRGVFSYVGVRYHDGRRAFDLPLELLVAELVPEWNRCVFGSGREHRALNVDAVELDPQGCDLLYLDPPYLTRQSADEYGYRYHFLEGLASYWQAASIQHETKTKKLRTPWTDFHDLSRVDGAFHAMADRFRGAYLLISRSARSRPGPADLVAQLRRHRRRVTVMRFSNEYSIGRVGPQPRNRVDEFLLLAEPV